MGEKIWLLQTMVKGHERFLTATRTLTLQEWELQVLELLLDREQLFPETESLK